MTRTAAEIIASIDDSLPLYPLLPRDELLVLVEAAKQREALLAACKGIASPDFRDACEIIEYGPGGTFEEIEAQKLIEQRMDAVRAAIAAAEGGAP